MKFDLATLDLADGTHTVKVKAKASGYIDSEFSNEVSYTKAPAGYSGTIISTYWTGLFGIKSDGTEVLLSMEGEGTYTVSGYFKYRIAYDYFKSDKYIVTTDKCTYEIGQWGYMITPSSNDFTFTVKRKSNA